MSLIRPWLLPGLTAGEWEEKGWLHTAQSARKAPNGRANTGQVIWRLGCIKALYKGLKGFMLPHLFGRCFYTTWQQAAHFSLKSIRKASKECCLHGCLAFVWLQGRDGFYGRLLTPGAKAWRSSACTHTRAQICAHAQINAHICLSVFVRIDINFHSFFILFYSLTQTLTKRP